MKRYLSIYLIAALALAMSMMSCNKDDDTSTSTSEYSYYSSSSTMVSGFALKANTKILNNLDSVKFTIDQDRGLIYNADSLPRGTRVSALLVDVTCASTVSSQQFVVKNGTVQSDTTITYKASSTDSIDFTGDVTLRITSGDKQHVRDYKVKVNVHQQDVDTILWNVGRRRDLPNVSSTLLASKTVVQNDNFICLIDDNGSYILNTTGNPTTGYWAKKVLSLPFTPQVNSFAATNSELFMLDTNGQLFKSEDNGDSWTDCGVAWRSIIGAYGDKLLGVVNNGGAWQHDEYPQATDFVATDIESRFPIEGMSPLVMASNEWTSSQQAMIVGGMLADGNLSDMVWGYDGQSWAPINNDKVFPAVRDAVLFPYYTMAKTSSGVSYYKRVTWMIMGGRLSDGKLNSTSYVSYNQGINWSKGKNCVQQPAHMPAFYGAQVYCQERYIHAGTTTLSYNPGHVTPVTEWTCPYLYLFGGYAANGNALNSIWEGVLTGLTFKPVF